MENYGFVPVRDNEAQQMGFPKAIGSFELLYDKMEDELESNRIKKSNIGKANNMTSNEKIISFLNNYFIFKKIRDPNAKEITNTLLTISDAQNELGKEETIETQRELKPKKKRVVKKYKKKLTLPK